MISNSTPVSYDELRDEAGLLRAHWQRYFEHLNALGDAEAKKRWSKAKQLLQENGASYNAYGDTSGNERPWRLSPIPLLIDSADWQRLARAIAQRASLLEHLLADLYGAQRCLTEGLLPSELLFENPRFLRPLHGLWGTKLAWLPMYGVDLIRGADGKFLALEDSIQTPSGMGYALENRSVVSQALRDLLRHCHVEALVPHFRLLREILQNAAHHNRDTPRIALLTPGPLSATYFEQAYLAKYLGISLVQGEDLTVRNDRVYLKTLGGLQPIDVLLRRVFDDFCDPLELRADSVLGIPGLVQAVRAGNVSLLNPLGTGVLDSPAFLAYLPALCRRFLNEELLLQSVPTFYLGDPKQLKQVMSNFGDMVVTPTYRTSHVEPIFVGQLSSAERDKLWARICATPAQFVAQRLTLGSRTPVYQNGALESHPFVLRCFAHCYQPNDFRVMPGGLALVAPQVDDLVVSIHRGARSKDVWVVSDDTTLDEAVASPDNPPIVLSRGGGDLPSRVADNLYWLGRYAERAETVSRLSRVIGNRILEFTNDRDLERSVELFALLNALRAQTRFLYTGDLPVSQVLTRDQCEAELRSGIVDADSSGSAINALRSTLRVSRIVRDRLSYDTQRILGALDDAATRCASITGHDQIALLVSELNQIVVSLAGFSGLVMESMTRGLAWRFLDMGRRLERAIALVTMLRATLIERSDRESQLLDAVLDIADSGMTYRRRYPVGLQSAPLVDLLIADDSNPRSVIYQLNTLGQHFAALPPLSAAGIRPAQQRILLAASSEVELSDITELCRIDATTHRRIGLASLLERLGQMLPRLSDSLTETYLYHTNVARHLQGNGRERSNANRVGGVS